jgi:hypothetical protein
LEIIEHKLELIPQPIADGWQAKCVCGWSAFSYFQDFDSPGHFGSKDEVLNCLRQGYRGHIKARNVISHWPRGHSVSGPSKSPVVFHRYWLKDKMDEFIAPVFSPRGLDFQHYTQQIAIIIVEARMEEEYHENQTRMFEASISAYRAPKIVEQLVREAQGKKIPVTVDGKMPSLEQGQEGKWVVFFSNQTCSLVDEAVAKEIKVGQEVNFQRVP